jgi:Zn-finger nucleic acid-binding protein
MRFRGAAERLNEHAKRADGARLVLSLNKGLTILTNTLFARLHADVERRIGVDSMLMPVSELATAIATRREIEIYQVAQCAIVVRQCHFLTAADDWFLDWLAPLRLETSHGEASVKARLLDYLVRPDDDRQRLFTNVLAKILPESTRAPLVVFTLYPLAIALVVVQAFGDPAGAESLRRRQSDILPSVRDCPECRGVVMENGEQCRACGNPLWTYEYLMAAD